MRSPAGAASRPRARVLLRSRCASSSRSLDGRLELIEDRDQVAVVEGERARGRPHSARRRPGRSRSSCSAVTDARRRRPRSRGRSASRRRGGSTLRVAARRNPCACMEPERSTAITIAMPSCFDLAHGVARSWPRQRDDERRWSPGRAARAGIHIEARAPGNEAFARLEKGEARPGHDSPRPRRSRAGTRSGTSTRRATRKMRIGESSNPRGREIRHDASASSKRSRFVRRPRPSRHTIAPGPASPPGTARPWRSTSSHDLASSGRCPANFTRSAWVEEVAEQLPDANGRDPGERTHLVQETRGS